MTSGPLPDGATQAQEELLRRILASPQFAHAESLQRILQFLYENTRAPGAPRLREYDVAVSAIHRPACFDPRSDAIVRVSITSIRERLRAYFDNEGRHERIRLVIPKGQYRVVFEPADQTELAADHLALPGPAVRTIWNPYLKTRAPNIMVYTELLCFRDDAGSFLRNIYINDPGADARQFSRLLSGDASVKLRPSYHFVSGGEMHGVLLLVQTFHQMDAGIQVKNSRFLSWSAIEYSNLIVLGSSRTNNFINSLQGEEQFVIAADSILNLNPRPGEPTSYRGSRFMDGKLERVVEHAIVTRRRGVVGDSTITLIAANHGRAMEGAVQFLTREDKAAGLLHVLGANEGSLPSHFQALLKVDMIDFDEEVINVECVSHRIA